MIKNVIFDLDGTLLNTTDGVLESAKYAASQMRYTQLKYETMLKFVGPPIQESFMNYYGCDKPTSQLAANIFRDYYKREALLKAEPYAGILDFCQWLKNNQIKMAVATYKREDYALKILDHFGFASYCTSMHGADNENRLTKADIINICIDELDCKREEVVLIGDTDYDAIGAEKANINFIGVTYGFGFKNKGDVDKHRNVGCATSIEDLYKLIIE